MDLLNPSVGLVVWMTLSFLLLLFLLRKFAWNAILNGLKTREESIEKALAAAKEAESRLVDLNSKAEALLAEARKERDSMLKDARANADRMLADAKEIASKKAEEMIVQAKATIHNEKMQAVTELRNQVGVLALEIAAQVLREQVSDTAKQQEIMDRSLREVTLN